MTIKLDQTKASLVRIEVCDSQGKFISLFHVQHVPGFLTEIYAPKSVEGIFKVVKLINATADEKQG